MKLKNDIKYQDKLINLIIRIHNYFLRCIPISIVFKAVITYISLIIIYLKMIILKLKSELPFNF